MRARVRLSILAVDIPDIDGLAVEAFLQRPVIGVGEVNGWTSMRPTSESIDHTIP